jgi:hypothetical protein
MPPVTARYQRTPRSTARVHFSNPFRSRSCSLLLRQVRPASNPAQISGCRTPIGRPMIGPAVLAFAESLEQLAHTVPSNAAYIHVEIRRNKVDISLGLCTRAAALLAALNDPPRQRFEDIGSFSSPPRIRWPSVRKSARTPVERRDVLGGLIYEYQWAARSGLLNPSRINRE